MKQFLLTKNETQTPSVSAFHPMVSQKYFFIYKHPNYDSRSLV